MSPEKVTEIGPMCPHCKTAVGDEGLLHGILGRPNPSGPMVMGKRSSNAPIREVEVVLKCRHEYRTASGSTATADASGGSAVSVGVCQQRHAAE